MDKNLMDLIGVKPMLMLKGMTGIYFKFSDCLSSNGQPVSLYFKPKFTHAPYDVGGGNVDRITWLEINILWVGPQEFPDFNGGWKPSREGMYHTKAGEKYEGVLLGKMYLPMGEFSDNMPEQYKWLVEHSDEIDSYISTALLGQVHGTIYMPVKTVFQYMLETLTKDNFVVDVLKVYLNSEMQQAVKKFENMAATKHSAKPPQAPAGDEGDDEDGGNA